MRQAWPRLHRVSLPGSLSARRCRADGRLVMTGLAAHTRHDRRAGQPRAAGTRSPAAAARAAPGPAGGDARRAASPLTWPLAVPERDRSCSGTAGPPGHAQPRPVNAVPGTAPGRPGLRASRRHSQRHRGTAPGTRPCPRFVITSAGSPASCARITSGNPLRRATRVLAHPRKEPPNGRRPGRQGGHPVSCRTGRSVCRYAHSMVRRSADARICR